VNFGTSFVSVYGFIFAAISISHGQAVTTTPVAIVNLKAANGKAARTWPTVRRQLPRDIEVLETRAPSHATELTATALKHGAQSIIVFGGDGTINEVVNGFFESDRNINPAAVLGIIPLGTGSDLRRSLNLPLDQDAAAFLALNGKPRPVDAMRVRYITHDGRPATRYAVNIVSFGLGGTVAAWANRLCKTFGSRAGFLIATGFAALRQRLQIVSLTLDGSECRNLHITNVAVGNGQFHGAGMWMCPDATLDDGLLDVTVIRYLSLFEIAVNVPMLYDGRILQHPKVQSYRVKHIRAHSPEPVPVEIDGEPLGRLPLEIDILPQALRILC
jgi:diacylglycerol kinase (ATP)